MKTDVGTRIVGPEKGMSIPIKEAPLGVEGLKLGTSLEQLLMGRYETEALRDFGERTLVQRLSKMSPEEIAQGIKDAGLTEPEYKGKGKKRIDVNKERLKEILTHLPDRARANVRRLLREKKYIPLPGARYAEARPSWGRMRALEAKALGEEELRARKKKARKKLRAPGKAESSPGLTEVRLL